MHNTVLDLCALSGISGREQTVRDYIIKQLQDAPSVSDITVDRLGNCIVSLKGEQPAPHAVAFAAHMDEVGGIVTGITADGFVRFDTVGGVNADVVFSKTVRVNGHVGVIGGKAVHQCQGDEKNKVPECTEQLIDIGADNEQEAREIVREGDAVLFSNDGFMLSNSAICAKALDDRVGCALLLRLAHTTPKYDTTLIFTVQEEIGTRGALTAAFSVQPEIAVVIDATTASDIAGVPSDKQVSCLGEGPVVSFMDRGTLYDADLYQWIRKLADEHHIPSQTKTTVAGGNDSRAFQCAGIGARVAAVSLPCRYIHSPACVLDENDVENTYRLLELLLNRLPTWEVPV